MIMIHCHPSLSASASAYTAYFSGSTSFFVRLGRPSEAAHKKNGTGQML